MVPRADTYSHCRPTFFVRDRSQVRKVEAAQSVISQARADGGFQGMRIGNDDTSLLSKLWNRINMIARGFVRSYSDLAMSHVAAYYKSYKKAARDVATLIDESGTLPLLLSCVD